MNKANHSLTYLSGAIGTYFETFASLQEELEQVHI